VTHEFPSGKVTTEAKSSGPLSGLILGADVATMNGLACDIAEVLVYDRVLHASESGQVTRSLDEHWQGAVDFDPQPVKQEINDPRITKAVVRREGDDNSKSYRIPGLAVTPKGTLIACFDIRWDGSHDLPADIDVGVMRSTDRGDTWGPMIVALDYDKNVPGSCGNGVGDPAVLVDSKTGHVFLAALWSKGDNAWNGSKPGMTPDETGQLVITRSADDGLTWEQPRSITPQIKQKEWKLLFNGPGAGICLKDGTLVFPAQFKNAAGKATSCFIFSTDQGENWKISPGAIPDSPPTSEAQIVQLADDSLLLTMRNESRAPRRLWSRWQWSGQLENGKWVDTWDEVLDPVCMAGLTYHPKGYVLLSNNNSTRRERLSIRHSKDGKAWSEARLLDARPTAYSCLTVLPDGDLGILYEGGDHSVETLTFARFPLEWVLETK
jgi:sialidase-1